MDYKFLNQNKFYQSIVNKKIIGIEDCPILDKNDYSICINEYIKKYGMRDNFWHSVFWAPTGGSSSSSGISMYFPVDIKENHKQRELNYKIFVDKEKYGIFSNYTSIINLFVGTYGYRSLELINDLASKANITTIPAGDDCDNKSITKFIKRFGADTLAGSSTKIADYSYECLSKNIQLDIKYILYASNLLYPLQRQTINQAFNTPEIHSIYGGAEVGVCGYHNSKILDQNQFIIIDDIAYIEIEDKDIDGFGRVIITNKIRKRFPIIRYNMGDIGKITKYKINCNLYNVLEIKGRNFKSLSFADNSISINFIDNILQKYARDWQIVQFFNIERVEIVQFNILPGYDNLDIYMIQKDLEKLLKVKIYRGALKIEVKFVQLGQFIKSKISQKIIRVVDHRNTTLDLVNVNEECTS